MQQLRMYDIHSHLETQHIKSGTTEQDLFRRTNEPDSSVTRITRHSSRTTQITPAIQLMLGESSRSSVLNSLRQSQTRQSCVLEDLG